MNDRIPVAVLAGGRILPSLARVTGADSKALISVGGRPIIDRMLDCLSASERAGPVTVVCPPGSSLLEHVGDVGVAARGSQFVDSLRTGLESLGRPERFLVVTGDLPLLTPASVDHFCREALQSGAAIVYPIVRKPDCERACPGGKRTYVRLLEGAFTGGNVAVLTRQFVEEHSDSLTRAFAARKNPLKLCAMFGFAFVLRLLSGRLSLTDVVRRAEEMLHTSVHVVVSPFPEIGFDVDKPANLASVESCLAGPAV